MEALAVENRLPFPEYEQGFVPTVVNTGSQLVVFDPGFGERAPNPELGRFNALFAEAGYDTKDVHLVVITHNHPDHIANLTTRAGMPTFPNAEIVVGRVDFEYWRRGDRIPDFRSSTLKLFREIYPPVADRVRLVEANREVVPGITAIPAFGHSAGHMAYRVESGGQGLVLMGDVTAHFVLSFQRPDWHFAMDDDKPAAVAARRHLLEILAEGSMMAMGFHLPFPSLGHVERFRDGYRWVPITG